MKQLQALEYDFHPAGKQRKEHDRLYHSHRPLNLEYSLDLASYHLGIPYTNVTQMPRHVPHGGQPRGKYIPHVNGDQDSGEHGF